MTDQCNCFNEYLEKIKQSIIEKILPDNASPETLEVDWENKVFRLDGKANNVMLKLDCEYQQKKKNGDLYKNKTKHPISIEMAYCPFCGTKY